MSHIPSRYKDPDSTLDYTFDWGEKWLETGDTIATSAWVVPAGLTSTLETNTLTTATIWLAGGALYERYTVTNQITTVNGRIAERSIYIRIREA